MTKRNNFVLLIVLVLVLALWWTPFVFAEKTYPAVVEQAATLEDTQRVEILRVCQAGPDCPEPWRISLRAKYPNDQEGFAGLVEDQPIEQAQSLTDAYVQSLLDGDATHKGANEERGHGKGNGNGGG